MNEQSQAGLKVLKCQGCGRLYVAPKYYCPACDSSELVETQLEGSGEIYTYTVIHIPFEEFEAEAPFIVAEVKLKKGLVVPARISDKNKQQIQIGAEVYFVEQKKKTNWFRLS